MRTVLRRVVSVVVSVIFLVLIAPAVLFVTFVVACAGLAAIAADRWSSR